MSEMKERFARTIDDFLTTDFVLRENITGLSRAVFETTPGEAYWA